MAARFSGTCDRERLARGCLIFLSVESVSCKFKATKTMKTKRRQILIAAALACGLAFTTTIARAADPLPSWNAGPAKKAIVEFVTKVTTAGSPDFVPVPERIATFDNDGTLA